MSTKRIACRKVVGGPAARGTAIVAETRLSFWGGLDAETGRITERASPLHGQEVAGSILVFVSSKGSSETSRVMAAANRIGKAPAAIINTEVDAMVALACVTSDIPLVTDLEINPFEVIKPGSVVTVYADRGFVEIED